MNQQPLISVVTVCYNSKSTIENTFVSILNQTYSNIEYIVIDGESNDGTLDLIKAYEAKFIERNISFKWMSEPDKGIYDAMNKGIKMTTGEIIGIINSDDYYENDALQIIANSYVDNNSYDVYHGLLKFYNSGNLSMIRGTDSSILPKHMIEHPTCFLKRTTYEKYGYFNCKYKYVADYELLCRIQKNKGKFKLIDEVIANFYDGGAGDSLESVIEALKFRYEYGFIKKYFYVISYWKIKLSRMIKS
ncbi:glycosyltransferase family 2 protein [Priestia megaterium]|uniref:glycosyltransferase family 2 protein n=1 Tax=Priestia megaterium TaxID=1404 RepID=UPI002B251850|nr:glycosyltransferase family 2 protein [Priestia megaterium]MEB2289970.1 glycosyltransferase [Priestia megaterium]